MWLDPKIDWTDADFYNFTDLDRVEINTDDVATILSGYLAEVINIITVTNRTAKRFEFYDSLNRIEGNIQLLATKFYKPSGWESMKTNWKTGQRFDWRDANRLERNLMLLRDLLLKTIDSLKYCGTFACGGDVI